MTGFKTAMGNDMKQEVFLADGYTPAEDEPFMNDRQVEYFRRKLLNWKQFRFTCAGLTLYKQRSFQRYSRIHRNREVICGDVILSTLEFHLVFNLLQRAILGP